MSELENFSAWVQISEGRETVSVVFKTTDGELVRGGEVIAEHGCWSLLKGGTVANFSAPVKILFQVKNFPFFLFPFISFFKFYLAATFQSQCLLRSPWN